MDAVATVENQGLKRDYALTLLREMLRIRRFEVQSARVGLPPGGTSTLEPN
jgi:hypothetical protein